MTFDEFWSRYPRRVAKADARKAWAKLDPSPELVAEIFDALAWQVRQESWSRDEGMYVPYPASWIRGERWTDEAPRVTAGSGRAGYSINEARAALAAFGGQDAREATGRSDRSLDAVGDCDAREGGPRRLRAVR